MSASAVALSLPPFYRSYDLPWSRVTEDNQRLRKIFLAIAGGSLLLSLAMPLLPSQPISHTTEAEMPPRLAKMLLERKAPPPPPAPVVAPPEPVVEAAPEPKQVREPKPQPQVAPAQVPPKLAFVPKPESPPAPVNEARERAARAGLIAMADELAELRDSSRIDGALSNRTLANAVGAAERTERSLVTSATGRASGGINTAALSRNTGGQGLAGRAVTQVASPVVQAGGASRADATSGGSAVNAGASGQRSRAQIEMTFDRNKAAIYALYRRALRSDPSLQGKLVLELTIAASGQVTDCRVLSSELNAPEFEARLVQRVRLFKFGPRDVGTITTTKPIDFFPV